MHLSGKNGWGQCYKQSQRINLCPQKVVHRFTLHIFMFGFHSHEFITHKLFDRKISFVCNLYFLSHFEYFYCFWLCYWWIWVIPKSNVSLRADFLFMTVLSLISDSHFQSGYDGRENCVSVHTPFLQFIFEKSIIQKVNRLLFDSSHVLKYGKLWREALGCVSTALYLLNSLISVFSMKDRRVGRTWCFVHVCVVVHELYSRNMNRYTENKLLCIFMMVDFLNPKQLLL